MGQQKDEFKEIQKKFTINCNKCNGQNIELYPANYDGLVGIKCTDCENKFTSY